MPTIEKNKFQQVISPRRKSCGNEYQSTILNGSMDANNTKLEYKIQPSGNGVYAF